ncbi:MAG: LysM peptidoglycan-binding domain-containing protein [Bacteroidota bacterium]
MKSLLLYLTIFFAGLHATAATQSVVKDSVGVALKNGNYFIIHEVAKSQTLFALSKVYKVSIQEILEANPGMPPAVQQGKLLYIPLKNYKAPAGLKLSSISDKGTLVSGDGEEIAEEKPAPAPKEEKKPEPKPVEKPTPVIEEEEKEIIVPPTKVEPEATEKYDWKNYKGTEDLVHKVKAGETLYKIATYYGVTVQELMELNGLDNSIISNGQLLVIRKAKAQEKPKKNDPAPKETKKEAPKTDKKQEPESTAESNSSGEVQETGMVLVIDKSFPDSDKNIALHTKAPVGTIILVTNPANNRSLYVRVVGKLESDDTSLIMMISPAAANELGTALTGKVKLTLSYAQ